MKTNHRSGDRKRQDRKKGFSGGIEEVKQEARKGRRAATRAAMAQVKQADPDSAGDVLFFEKNTEISNIWNWD